MKRPETVDGKTRLVKTGCGNLFITVGEEKGKVIEVFCRMGKGGGCAASQCEAIGRLLSTALQYGTPLLNCINAIRGIICHMKNAECSSCADAVAKVLTKYLKE